MQITNCETSTVNDAIPINTSNLGTNTIGHYHISRQIGAGGMGLVYLARDTRLERQVAIKCLRSELFEENYIERFKREALLLAKLNHPNIVQIYDFIETKEQLALVMEWVEGDNLQRYLRENIVPLPQRMQWLVQIAEGLAVAHDAGIIHRDLKPENILINKFNQAKISDLGIAKSLDIKSVLTDHTMGSYCAMSPEQATGNAIDHRSDLFALGILAYQLLCGVHPFGDAANKLQMIQRIISQPPTPPHQHCPALAPEIISILSQLLAKNPTNRPINAHWVAAQLANMCTQLKTHHYNNNNTQVYDSSITPPTNWHTTYFSGFHKIVTTSIALPVKTYLLKYKIIVAVSFLLIAAAIQLNLTPYAQDKTKNSTSLIENIFTSISAKKLYSPKEFSQTQTLTAGFDALRFYDRPGSLNTAENNFTIILEKNSSNAAAIAGLSLVYSYHYSGDSEDLIWLQKADASAQQALQLNPQLALAHVARGYVFTAKANHDAAFAAFSQALLYEPTNIFAWRGKVTALRSAQHYDKAIQLAEQGLKKFPQERFFADELGTVYIEQHNYSKAEKAFKLSIQLQPDAVYAYASLYIALEQQNRADEALQILQQGLQIRSSSWLYGNLGNALFLRGDYVGAAAAFEAAVSPTKGNPNSHLAWANLADALRWIPVQETETQNAYRKARDLLAPLLKLRPEDVTLISRMALYSARLTEPTQAKELLSRVMALAPKNGNVHFRTGLAYELLGDRDAAIAALTKAVELGFPVKLIQAEPDLLSLRRTSGAF